MRLRIGPRDERRKPVGSWCTRGAERKQQEAEGKRFSAEPDLTPRDRGWGWELRTPEANELEVTRATSPAEAGWPGCHGNRLLSGEIGFGGFFFFFHFANFPLARTVLENPD